VDLETGWTAQVWPVGGQYICRYHLNHILAGHASTFEQIELESTAAFTSVSGFFIPEDLSMALWPRTSLDLGLQEKWRLFAYLAYLQQWSLFEGWKISWRHSHNLSVRVCVL